VLLDRMDKQEPLDYKDLVGQLDHRANLVIGVNLVSLACQVSTINFNNS